MGAEYLITGGAGFIGSNIAEELARRGESVRILDNFSTGRWGNIATFQDKVEIVEGEPRGERACPPVVHVILVQPDPVSPSITDD